MEMELPPQRLGIAKWPTLVLLGLPLYGHKPEQTKLRPKRTELASGKDLGYLAVLVPGFRLLATLRYRVRGRQR
jgi:hypothetical protein